LHGAKVVITGRRREVLDAAVAGLTAAGVTATGLQGDVRNPEACQGWVTSTVQQHGHLDILVNCAAGNFLANASELSQGGFKTGEQLNAPFIGTQWVKHDVVAVCIGGSGCAWKPDG
jgi:peroxisomal 2,4-dienoyl-CoA reductase